MRRDSPSPRPSQSEFCSSRPCKSGAREKSLRVLQPESLVAAAALLADDGKRRFQRIEIPDLALGIGHDLGEASDMFVEACLVFPDFRRATVIAVRLQSLHALGEQRRQLL